MAQLDHHSRHHEGRQRQEHAGKLPRGPLAPQRPPLGHHRRRSATHDRAAWPRARRRSAACTSSRTPPTTPARRRNVSSATYDTVIIDTPGFRSQATLACLGVTDFVLVPVKPSPFDVDRMLDTLNILINGVSGRRPVFRCVLTQTTRDSVIAKHIRSELAEAGFPVLDSEMTNRVVYAEAALWGATPSLVDREGPAAREIAAIADEVEHICESMAQVKRAASA